MGLMDYEQKEWTSIRKKSKRHKIPVKRTGPANVSFGEGVYAQLGLGRATMIMDARVRLKKKKRR